MEGTGRWSARVLAHMLAYVAVFVYGSSVSTEERRECQIPGTRVPGAWQPSDAGPGN